jgi:hypothetical protein
MHTPTNEKEKKKIHKKYKNKQQPIIHFLVGSKEMAVFGMDRGRKYERRC